MKPDAHRAIEAGRVTAGPFASTAEIGNNGMFHVKRQGVALRIVVSDGVPANGDPRWANFDWDHVSVSCENRCPTWDEMCFVKDLFFDPEETVMQLHPPQSTYVNHAQYCLHLWRPHSKHIPLPPPEMVGPTGGK